MSELAGSHQQTAEPEPTAGDWFTARRFAALLGLLIVVSFPLVVAGFETFVNRDYGRFAYPVAFHWRESFWRGEMPLWNPLSNCGVPFLAQWNTMTLYPPALFYLVFPLPWSLGVLCLGHLFFAGMGMYCLAQRWTGNRLAGAVAGTSFAFNGLMWYGLIWPNIVAALAWMPWVVLVVESCWREGRRQLVLAALAGAMQVLSGGAEVIVLTWLFLGALGLYRFIQAEIPRWEMVRRSLCAGCLIAGLTAVQMAPFLDLLAHSQRDVNYGDSMGTPMPLSGWANYLVPRFHGFRTAQGMYLQPEQGWTASYYLGVGIVALALLAIWQVRRRQVWFLAALALFSLTMALGSHCFLYGWVKQLVPLLGLMRFPIKFVLLATFIIPLLAAYGLNRLLTLPAENCRREWKRAVGLMLGLLGLMAVILWFAWKHPLPTDNFTATVVDACVRALFLVLIFGCFALLRRACDPPWQRLWQTGLILLLWLDVRTHALNLSLTAACSVFEPGVIRQYFNWGNQLKPGVSRAKTSQASTLKMAARLTSNMEADTYGRRLSLFLNLNLLDQVPKCDGFFPLSLKECQDVLERMYARTNGTRKFEDFLGVSHVSHPTNAVDWLPRDSFLPLITAGQRPVYADNTNTLQAMFSDDFEPLATVYLPLEAQGKLTVNERASVRIMSSHFSSHRLEAEVEADAPGMMTIAQAYYHPWRAYVDERPVPLWRANGSFQALEVPVGNHHVKVVYEDKLFVWGAIMSLASILACVAVWFWRERNPREVPASKL